MGPRGLVPWREWGSAPRSLGENKRRGIDPVLTTIARGWTAPKNVGTALFPDVSVPAMGRKIISFGAEAWRDFDTVRAPGARAAELQMGYEGEDFALQRHSMDAKGPREWMQDAHQHSQQSQEHPQQNQKRAVKSEVKNDLHSQRCQPALVRRNWR